MDRKACGIVIVFGLLSATVGHAKVREGCQPSVYPSKQWCAQSADGIPYSQTFSHQSENRHNMGGRNTGGVYCVSGTAGEVRITNVAFRCEGAFCGWNYNPDGGYAGNVEIQSNKLCFTWRRRWDGKPATEIYQAIFERLETQ